MKDKKTGRAAGWETIEARYIHESPWHNIRQDKVRVHGKEITYTWLEHPGSVFVVPVTLEGQIVLIRTYRYTVDDWCWEVPAGGIGDKRDLSLEEAARAEMREETGYAGGVLERLGQFYTGNGVMDLELTAYLARGVEASGEQELEHTELIERVGLFSQSEVLGMLERNEIKDGESALCLTLALAKLSQAKQA